MATIRDALAQARPPVAISRAWRTVLQVLRADRRNGGGPVHLAKRATIERFVDTPLHDGVDVPLLKERLAALMHAEDTPERVQLARLIDAQVLAQSPTVRSTPVALTITGWPLAFGATDQARFLGVHTDLGSLDPAVAAQLVRDVDGVTLAGQTLRVRAALAPGEVLPPIPRINRERSRRHSQAPWLPHTDDTGRWSASSAQMAARTASLIEQDTVIDAFCGCGGDAIGLARAGKQVIAIEEDRDRSRMALQNAAALGVGVQIAVHHGDANEWVPRLAGDHPDAALYLDPPWGGPGGVNDGMTWQSLVPESIRDCALSYPCVVLKAPRSFDVGSLPAGGAPWRVTCHYRSGVHPPDTVVALVLVSDRSAT